MQPILAPTFIPIPDALGRDEIGALLSYGRRLGYGSPGSAYPPSYRTNDRLVVDDEALARWLFSRLRASIPEVITEPDGTQWQLVGLNPRLRSCRYRAGQFFAMHRDGAHHRGHDERSFLTVMLYLNGAPDFVGGATRFFHDRAGSPAFEIAPRPGLAVVFSHRWWHDGAPLEAGDKYILRSDVMYRRRTPSRAADGHAGYVWSVACTDDGLVVSGGRDKTVRVWRDGQGVATLRGHTASVTCVVARAPGELWSASRDGTLRRWTQSSSGAWSSSAPVDVGGGTIIAACATKDGVACGTSDGRVTVWSADGRTCARARRHSRWVWAVVETPQGVLVSASEDGVVTDGRHATQLDAAVTSLCACRDDVLAGQADGRLLVLDRRLRPIAAQPAHAGPITSITAMTGGRFATAGEDDRIRIWSATDHRGLRCLGVLSHDDFVRSLAVTGDGRLVSAAYDGRVRVWSDAEVGGGLEFAA